MLESGIEPSNFDFDNKKRTCFCESLETIKLNEKVLDKIQRFVSRLVPVEDDDPLHIILPRGEIMDIIADETKTFNCIERLAEFVFTLMTCKSCKICDIDFVGFSIDDMVCNSCYMKMKTKDFNKSDALCIVCHNEGDELDEKTVMTTPCCNKVLCLSCRSKIKPKVINSKIKIPCPTCRDALPELSHDTMLTNFSILNLTT